MLKQTHDLYHVMIHAIATTRGEATPSIKTMQQAGNISKNAASLAFDKWWNNRLSGNSFWMVSGSK